MKSSYWQLRFKCQRATMRAMAMEARTEQSGLRSVYLDLAKRYRDMSHQAKGRIHHETLCH